MRFGICCAIWLLLGIELASSQTQKTASPTPAPTPTPTPAFPEFRPALIGSGPNSLINILDAAELIKKGQKEAAVMFSCLVSPTGDIVRSGAYRGTLNSELLEQELLKGMATAKFIPAFRSGQPVEGKVKIPVYYKKPE